MSRASISLQLLPQTNIERAYEIVDLVLDMISKEQDITYVVGPMDTVIEGELTQLLTIVKKAIAIGEAAGCPQHFAYVKVFTDQADGDTGLLDSVRPAMERHNLK